MSEKINPKEKHDLYKKIGIWIVLSALVLTGLALIVGVVFDEIESDRATIEAVEYMPLQQDHSRSTSTMSYGMAARYSDGSTGALPDMFSGPFAGERTVRRNWKYWTALVARHGGIRNNGLLTTREPEGTAAARTTLLAI